MKLSGIFGKGSGKVGSSVFAVSGGEQIVREYNPKVSNPNTDAQIEQRAKLKLLSQIAAALSTIIAFAKKGLVSARNQFISANYPNVTFNEGKATIGVASLDLTGGSETLPYIVQGENNGIGLEEGAASSVQGVLYAVVHCDDEDKLTVTETVIVNTPGADRKFATTLTKAVQGDYVYGYGFKYANASDKVRFDNYFATIGEQVADLEVIKSMTLTGATFTVTRGIKLA